MQFVGTARFTLLDLLLADFFYTSSSSRTSEQIKFYFWIVIFATVKNCFQFVNKQALSRKDVGYIK